MHKSEFLTQKTYSEKKNRSEQNHKRNYRKKPYNKMKTKFNGMSKKKCGVFDASYKQSHVQLV